MSGEESPDTSREALIERGAVFDFLRDDPAWVADCVEGLWDDPDGFESGEAFERPEGVPEVDYNLFRFGVILGVEYEREYPSDVDGYGGDGGDG